MATTAELIKKKQEAMTQPLAETKPSLLKMAQKPKVDAMEAEKPSFSSMVEKPDPMEGANPQSIDNESANRYRAEMTRQGAPDVLQGKPVEPRISLYEVGKQNAGASKIAKSEEEMKSPSPISTPEYEKFRNEVIGAREFGVETEEQRKKRERADYIRQGLVGLTDGLSSLANLYYTTKWAPNQKREAQLPKLQQQLYRERLERDKKLENFRAWQRSKADKAEERAFNLNLYNMKQEAEAKKTAQKAKADAQTAQIKYLYDLGLIDARHAADMEAQKGKAALDKELETIRQRNRVALKTMPSYGDNKVKTSAMSSDEVMMTRTSPLSKEEAMQIVYMSPDYINKLDDYRKTTTTTDEDGNPKTSVGDIDWFAAASDVLANGSISSDVLNQMGFSQIGGEKKGNKSKSLPGVKAGGEKEGKKSSKHLNL